MSGAETYSRARHRFLRRLADGDPTAVAGLVGGSVPDVMVRFRLVECVRGRHVLTGAGVALLARWDEDRPLPEG